MKKIFVFTFVLSVLFASNVSAEQICVYAGEMNNTCYYSCPDGSRATAQPQYRGGRWVCPQRVRGW